MGRFGNLLAASTCCGHVPLSRPSSAGGRQSCAQGRHVASRLYWRALTVVLRRRRVALRDTFLCDPHSCFAGIRRLKLLSLISRSAVCQLCCAYAEVRCILQSHV